ncbi:MAG: hypothetical protein RQ866_08815, partial [Bacteroidales bacterium]|nr:hypothetical protein [Bacteroidales bacterium]
MIKRFIYLSILVLAIPAAAIAQNNYTSFADSADISLLQQHVYYLASDELQGRNTGEPGQKEASQYIALHFQNYGLSPINGDDRSIGAYMQHFSLVNSRSAFLIIDKENKYTALPYIGQNTSPDILFQSYLFTGNHAPRIEERFTNNQCVVMIGSSIKEVSDDAQRLISLGARNFMVVMDDPSMERALKKYFRFLSTEKPENRQPKNEISELPALHPDAAFYFIEKETAIHYFEIDEAAIKAYDKTIKNSGIPVTLPISLTITFFPETVNRIETENVAGFIEGGDKKDEWV